MQAGLLYRRSLPRDGELYIECNGGKEGGMYAADGPSGVVCPFAERWVRYDVGVGMGVFVCVCIFIFPYHTRIGMCLHRNIHMHTYYTQTHTPKKRK